MSATELIKNGCTDEGAIIDAFYKEFHGAISGQCHSMLDNCQEAEEAISETYLKALARFSKLRSVKSLRNWICKIAFRTCLDRIKRRKRRNELEINEDLQSIDPTEEHLVTVIAIKQALKKIKPEYARIVVMCDFDGLGQGEVAKQLGITNAALRGLLHRGRRDIKKLLMDEIEIDSKPIPS